MRYVFSCFQTRGKRVHLSESWKFLRFYGNAILWQIYFQPYSLREFFASNKNNKWKQRSKICILDFRISMCSVMILWWNQLLFTICRFLWVFRALKVEKIFETNWHRVSKVLVQTFLVVFKTVSTEPFLSENATFYSEFFKWKWHKFRTILNFKRLDASTLSGTVTFQRTYIYKCQHLYSLITSSLINLIKVLI